jgi:hypothetical protein
MWRARFGRGFGPVVKNDYVTTTAQWFDTMIYKHVVNLHLWGRIQKRKLH